MNEKLGLILSIVDSMKKMHAPSKVEKVAEEKQEKPKAKKYVELALKNYNKDGKEHFASCFFAGQTI